MGYGTTTLTLFDLSCSLLGEEKKVTRTSRLLGNSIQKNIGKRERNLPPPPGTAYTNCIRETQCTNLTFLPSAVVEIRHSSRSFLSSASTFSTSAGKLGSSKQSRRMGSNSPGATKQWRYASGRITAASPK